MTHRPLALASLLLLLAACGSSSPGDDQAPAAGGAGANDTGTAPRRTPPAHVVGGFSIDVPPVHLEPGEEKTPCWLFPLSPDGASRIVGGGKLTVGAGMHHGNITTRPKTGEGVRECPDGDASAASEGADILAGGTVLFGSSTQISGEEWQSFPDGMGYRVKDGFEIVARMHYLNATTEALEVAPKYEWFTIDEASMTQEIAPFAWQFSNFELPPKTTTTVTATCAFEKPMHVVEVLPHMHRLGTAFDGHYVGGAKDGQPFLLSKGFDPDKGVLKLYDPAVDLSQGTGASWSCTWNNTTGKTLHEGIGDDEMCILFGYAYPPENAYSALATELGSGDTRCVPTPGPKP